MTDTRETPIEQRLREQAGRWPCDPHRTGLMREAADTIATLTAELAQARQEKEWQYDQAVEATQRALVAERDLQSAQQDALRAAAEDCWDEWWGDWLRARADALREPPGTHLAG
jgi:hypothetical protein